MIGGEDVLASESAPPRYAWEPTSAEPRGARDVGGYPRAVCSYALAFDVHCHGADYDGAWLLVCALATALERVTGADARCGSIRFVPPSESGCGVIATVAVEIGVPVPETLEAPAWALARVTSTLVAPAADAVDGDGRIDPPLS